MSNRSLTISVDPKQETFSTKNVFVGDEAKLTLGANDSVMTLKLMLAQYEDYPKPLQQMLLASCINFVTDEGYVIRKAGY